MFNFFNDLKESASSSHGLEFDPRVGYRIADPEDFHHNGTYLCQFTDTGKGRQSASLEIDLVVVARNVSRIYIEVGLENNSVCALLSGEGEFKLFPI